MKANVPYKIPFIRRWIAFFWWMPKMELGFFKEYYDGITYWYLNAYLFSIQLTDSPYTDIY